jgi:hypothetical protein
MSQVTAPASTRSARIREQLGHPVIDGDGHVIEHLPVFADFYELVGDGILDHDQLRDYLFTNSVELYGSLDPQFFAETVIEREAVAVLERRS